MGLQAARVRVQESQEGGYRALFPQFSHLGRAIVAVLKSMQRAP